MKHPKSLVILILLLIFYNSSGQADFRKAYYLNHEGDTIYGEIKYQGDLKNTLSCEYRAHKNANVVRFAPGDIHAYRFVDSKYFISKYIETDHGEEQIFAEYLINGIAKLFYYRDLEGDHYLLENREGHHVELTNEKQIVEISGRSYWAKGYQHVGLLKASFMDCLEIQSEIDDVILDHKSLIDITESYHNYVCDGEACIVYQKEVPRVKVNISPTVGISVSKLILSNSIFYERFDFQPVVAPVLGMMMHINAPRINEKLSLQLGFDFLRNTFKSYYEEYRSSTYTYYYHANATTSYLRFWLALKYKYPRGKIRPTLALGPIIQYFSKSEFWYSLETPWNYIINEDAPLTDLLFGGYVSVGIDILLFENLTGFLNLNVSRTSGWQNEITIFRSATLSTGIYF